MNDSIHNLKKQCFCTFKENDDTQKDIYAESVLMLGNLGYEIVYDVSAFHEMNISTTNKAESILLVHPNNDLNHSIWSTPYSSNHIPEYLNHLSRFHVMGNILRDISKVFFEPTIVLSTSDLNMVIQSIQSKGRVSSETKKLLISKALMHLSKVDEIYSKLIMDPLYPRFGYNKKVLLIGSGGREHAIAHKLSSSYAVQSIVVAPGNGGTAMGNPKISNITLDIGNIKVIEDYVKENHIDLVVVGPEQPLVDGVTDAMNAIDIPCFGPTSKAAIIEASKAWSKDFMSRHNIRTAVYQNFIDINKAKEYVHLVNHSIVVKASGLAAGKGVIIPTTKAEAIAAIDSIMSDKVFGSAGVEVVIEEFLDGEEVSVLAFCDGKTIVGMPGAQDHKRVYDHDQGPNTGGMGAYAPAPILTPALNKECLDIMQRVIDGMASEGRVYKGVLYGGFMILPNNNNNTSNNSNHHQSPAVLEFNCRFGDPETQVLLPLLDSDLYEIFIACSEGILEDISIRWKPKTFASTVVCAAGGYPESYTKGYEIKGLSQVMSLDNVTVYHAGTMVHGGSGDNNPIVTNGGRVLTVTGIGKSLKEAVEKCYGAISFISFDGMHYRKDIAHRGINAPLRIGVIGSTRGTSLQPIIDAIEQNQLPNTKIAVVISNKSDAPILSRATTHHIKSISIPYLKGMTRETYDSLVTEVLESEAVDLVILIGYMRIVSGAFTTHWLGRCINVHPSLLPDFAGGMDLQVHSDVIQAKKTISGCTIHLVTEQVDGGPIVIQETCPVLPVDTPETLKARVQPLEGIAFIKAIQMFQSNNRSFLSIAKPQNSNSLTYKDAGVDIDAGEELVRRISPYCKATRRLGCDAELGGFGGLFDLNLAGYDSNDTILVSGTDGVGTKLKIAQSIGIHDTIGIDLVAMCVNDVLVCGAEPLFFLDYYATGHLNVVEAADVIKGIAEGCLQSGSALIGGETAEMAGMYADGEYDLAGFSVGAVRRDSILPRNVMASDILLGLRSSGVHSNGYSLVRKCVEKVKLPWDAPSPFAPGQTLGEALLTPTKIYVKLLHPLIKKRLLKGMAHITGGGLLDNLPRVLPKGVDAIIEATKCNWNLPPVFQWLQGIAKLPQDELLRTFNCGIGMVLIIGKDDLDSVITSLKENGEEDFYLLGYLQAKKETDTDSEPKVIVIGDVL